MFPVQHQQYVGDEYPRTPALRSASPTTDRRPNAKADILDVIIEGGNDPVITNYFTGPNEDKFGLDSRIQQFLPAPDDTLILTPSLVIHLGSHTIFPGEQRPVLEWFETIIPSQIMPGIGSFCTNCQPQLMFQPASMPIPMPGFPGSATYDLTNTVITHNAPEPATAAMMLIGAITALRRKRRR
ncbi:MAG: PEP-CTERM sorting domain-containing protein [Planctomycetota bacterium]|jgi:hypothetical protein|nr:PEP-CTERM sorting domain-containing protein [Planctomycetota bacterium]